MGLRSLYEVSQELADQFGIPAEVVEAIIIEWLKILYRGVTNNEDDDLLSKV
jgi:hypothetical protein